MRVLRWTVPVDDQDHVIDCGRITHVDCRQADVEFWATDVKPHAKPRTFRVFDTGQEFPEGPGWLVIGTALTPASSGYERGALVWHLAERIER